MDEVCTPLDPSTRTEHFAAKDLLSNPFTDARLVIRIGRENPISLWGLESRSIEELRGFRGSKIGRFHYGWWLAYSNLCLPGMQKYFGFPSIVHSTPVKYQVGLRAERMRQGRSSGESVSVTPRLHLTTSFPLVEVSPIQQTCNYRFCKYLVAKR